MQQIIPHTPPDPSPLTPQARRHRVFFMLFGVSFIAFASGFSDCLFDISTADSCVAHAASWVDDFKAVGDHLIAWLIAIISAAFSQ